MGLGLLLLVSVGKENLYLSADPEITYFKAVYKKHTNFSTELITQYFKTTPDFGKRVTVNLSKNADLLHQIYLYIELPSISESNHSYLPTGIKKFKWVDKIGLSLIKFIDLEIGGVLISRQYVDYLNIKYELNTPQSKIDGYNKMIGNVSELNTFTNGKNSYKLYVPLDFWFCQDSGLALPLIAMTHHDVKIHVEFNDFENCYIESPTNYLILDKPICLFQENEFFYQEVDGIKYIGEFVYFDVYKQRLYYNKIKDDFQIPTSIDTISQYKLIGYTTGFEANIKISSSIIKDEDYFNLNYPSLNDSYLMVNYVYLGNQERLLFLTKNHEYIIPIVQNVSEQVIYGSNNKYSIPLFNPTKTIFWRCIMVSNKNLNDHFNYTTYPITDKKESIIENHNIIINSQKRLETSNYQHYSYLQNYQSDFLEPQEGIYSYSFSLEPTKTKPSGSLNFSKLDDSYLQLKMNKIVNYQNPVSIKLYSVHYNVLRVVDGLGSLVYYL